MRTIWKYYINIGIQFIPKGAKFLTMQYDGYGQPAVWYEVETENEKEEIYIFTTGTGYDLDKDGVIDCNYLGSYVEGNCIWHVYSKYFDIKEHKEKRNFLNRLSKDIREEIIHGTMV